MRRTYVIKYPQRVSLYYFYGEKEDQKFSSFNSSLDEKMLVVSGTTKSLDTGENKSIVYVWKASKNGVLKKGGEAKICTKYLGGNLIDIIY